jgi:hypothetical protein
MTIIIRDWKRHDDEDEEPPLCAPKPQGCGRPVGPFRDERYLKGYRHSGLCQDCQDKLFNGPEPEGAA